MPEKKRRTQDNIKRKSNTKTGSLGKIFVHQKGFGFVRLDKSGSEKKDVFIPKKFLMGAIDQDRVEVQITSTTSPKGPEGKILRVVERSKKLFPAIVIRIEEKYYEIYVRGFTQDSSMLLEKNKTEKELTIGTRILVSIKNKKKKLDPHFFEVIGHIDSANSDYLFSCFEQDIASTFPKSCIEEAEKLGSCVKKIDLENRLDLRHLQAMTIDPETAKDFDDALSIRIDEKNHFLLGVHIADAAYYVQPESALDAEAKKRANSTYFPGKCVPMLPENLSNGLCSLQPCVDRLAVSILMKFDPEGILCEKRIVRSVIHSKKRWTYPEALSCLLGKKKSPFKKDLENLATLAKLLKKQRQNRGSIDFSLTDTKIIVDKQGEPYKIVQEEYDITHQLVEEFMLKANEIVASTLSEKNRSCIYRIHEPPQQEPLQEFINIARTLGFFLPEKPEAKDLQTLFHAAKGSLHFSRLCVHFIRAMKLAFYSTNNLGHYGLKLSHYTHFTSPIRRYADLLIQRTLFKEKIPENLDAIAEHISDQERKSMKAENNVLYLKKLRLLAKEKKEHPKKRYDAIISSVKPYVLFFELQTYLLEGSLHVSEIGRDYFVFDPKNTVLLGQKTKTRYAVGDQISVYIVQIDLLLQQIKFSL